MLRTHFSENILLNALPAEALHIIMPHLLRQEFKAGQALYSSGVDPDIDFVYFPTTAVMSMSAPLSEGDQVEALPIGCEGLAGFEAIFGSAHVAEHWSCTIPGFVMRMSVKDFWSALNAFSQLGRIMLCYSQSLVTALANSVSCNTKHSVRARCAKWLLMTHDRVQGNAFPITHESLALLLGVRRASVSVEAGELQKAGLIRYARGHMMIVDRAGLLAESCECFEMISGEYGRLMLRSADDAIATALFVGKYEVSA
jgi:CRP-like cAMP-binding protein